jgi:hypothetical protein
MTRNRQSAKQAGTRFERTIADYLATTLNDDRVDRRIRNGTKDRGDITGLRLHGQTVVVECKNTTAQRLAEWAAEADIEAGNDDALLGVVVSKRRGVGDPARQWVHMELRDLVAILTGQRQPR